jgi:AcrR family transcriptional regulator
VDATLLYVVFRIISLCIRCVGAYNRRVPKLWNDTIEEHRRTVNEAILDTAAAFVAEHAITSVTMSAIAERTGIGRATLYKYFPDVDSILLAWHERQVSRELRHLIEAGDATGSPYTRLETVLTTYAHIRRQHHAEDVAVALHHGEQARRGHRQLREFVRELVTAAAQAGEVRTDTDPDELAVYCLHALGAAGALDSEAAVRRLLTVTLSGLKP